MFAAAGSRVAEFIGKEKVRAKTFDGRLEADDGEDDRYWCREQKRRESLSGDDIARPVKLFNALITHETKFLKLFINN